MAAHSHVAMTATVKRFARVEMVLLVAQLMAIGLMSMFANGWETQVDRVLGSADKLPQLAAQIYRHHTLFFAGAALFPVLLYGICFQRYDRITAGRRFVVLSLAAFIVLTCLSVASSALAWDTIKWQSIKWNTGEKLPVSEAAP